MYETEGLIRGEKWDMGVIKTYEEGVKKENGWVGVGGKCR